MQKSTSDKLARIIELTKKKEEIERQLDDLLNPEPKIPLPANFSLNEAILEIVKQHPDRITAKEILTKLREKFPSIEREKVNSAIVYLYGPNKKLMERIGQGVYKLAQTGTVLVT